MLNILDFPTNVVDQHENDADPYADPPQHLNMLENQNFILLSVTALPVSNVLSLLTVSSVS
jgi:hypothetical protein